MESIKEIYKVGHGPSSSHTMGPRYAAERFVKRVTDVIRFTRRSSGVKKLLVTLYGSLAATGKGHLTDVAIYDILNAHGETEIVWRADKILPFHPNGMNFKAFGDNDILIDDWTVYSVGGGALAEEGKPNYHANIYEMSTITEIQKWCQKSGKTYWEYVDEREGSGLWDYLKQVWDTMQACIKRGLDEEGVLPGPLGVRRKAVSYLMRAQGLAGSLKSRGLVYAYALAVSEENASGKEIVTAPTCGSCGVMPAVLYHLYTSKSFSEKRILRALATAGLFGNVVKTNASISGAEVGCQGEVGVACAMASAAASQLFGGTPAQIEYAAEMGLEHHLGLTCDPMCGMVQIPCIERNAYAAARALDANLYSTFSDGIHTVSFDKVVAVMKQTGKDLPSLYKETSEGGLAVL